MSIFKKVMFGAAAMSMTALPVVAHAADASKLSIAPQARVGKVTKANEKAVAGGYIIAVLAAAAVIAGIVIVADSDDSPNSP